MAFAAKTGCVRGNREDRPWSPDGSLNFVLKEGVAAVDSDGAPGVTFTASMLGVRSPWRNRQGDDKPGVILDYDEHGDLPAIEILDASLRVTGARKIEYETT
jgi:hypothetical protein